MRHCVIILAHKNEAFISRLIEYFCRDCYVIVHFDKKSRISPCLLSQCEQTPYVKAVLQLHRLHWGGISLLRCELSLLKRALECCDADYFHFISGQDYPTRPLDQFLSFFEKCSDVDFLPYHKLPLSQWDNPAFDRLRYIYTFDLFEKREKAYRTNVKICKIQDRFGLKKRPTKLFQNLYGGSQWFSIRRKSARLLVDYTEKKPAFFRSLRWSFAPEEIYPSTILANLLPHSEIVPGNKRLIVWKWENGNRPANLGVKRFIDILEQDVFFARKMEYPFCSMLVDWIDRFLLYNDNTPVKGDDGVVTYNGYLSYDLSTPFFMALEKICVSCSVRTVMDIGCGCGFYVARLSQRGYDAHGYDANPYTEELSQRLLPNDIRRCHWHNLFDGRLFDKSYDLVICKDVISGLPEPMRERAIEQIVHQTDNTLVINLWSPDDDFRKFELSFVARMNGSGFTVRQEETELLRDFMKPHPKNLYVVFNKKH